jgi:hypothetical protein
MNYARAVHQSGTDALTGIIPAIELTGSFTSLRAKP